MAYILRGSPRCSYFYTPLNPPRYFCFPEERHSPTILASVNARFASTLRRGRCILQGIEAGERGVDAGPALRAREDLGI